MSSDPVLDAIDAEAEERAKRFEVARAVAARALEWARDPSMPPLADDVREALEALPGGNGNGAVQLEPAAPAEPEPSPEPEEPSALVDCRICDLEHDAEVECEEPHTVHFTDHNGEGVELGPFDTYAGAVRAATVMEAQADEDGVAIEPAGPDAGDTDHGDDRAGEAPEASPHDQGAPEPTAEGSDSGESKPDDPAVLAEAKAVDSPSPPPAPELVSDGDAEDAREAEAYEQREQVASPPEEDEAEPEPSQGSSSSHSSAAPTPPPSPSPEPPSAPAPARRRPRGQRETDSAEVRERVMADVKKHPGSTGVQIAKRVLSGSTNDQSKVSYHLRTLEKAGRVRHIEGAGSSKHWQPDGEEDDRMPLLDSDSLAHLRGDDPPPTANPRPTSEGMAETERLILEAIENFPDGATAAELAEAIEPEYIDAEMVRKVAPRLCRNGRLTVRNGPGGPYYGRSMARV